MKHIKQLRELRGLTQRQLSAMAGIPVWNICRYEKGTRSLTISAAARIAAALGCTIDELVRSDDKPAKEA